RPELAGPDAPGKLCDERKEAVVLADRRLAAAQLRPLRKLLRSLEIAGKRLLADDVLADAKGFTHKGRMQIVRGRDMHHIDGRIAKRREIGHRRRSADRTDHLDADALERIGVRLAGVACAHDESPGVHARNWAL